MDLLDILLEIQEDESSEINITRENVKAFILVSIFSNFHIIITYFILIYMSYTYTRILGEYKTIGNGFPAVK
jgi:hypothetical protein